MLRDETQKHGGEIVFPHYSQNAITWCCWAREKPQLLRGAGDLLSMAVVVVGALILVAAAFVGGAVPAFIVAPLSPGRREGHAEEQAQEGEQK